MNINKLIHGPNVAGQSLVDRVMAAKHSLAGQGLAKSVCKATTEEVIAPKKKHVDYLVQCTHEPNVSVPQMAGLLLERSENFSWVVVYKSLISTHSLFNYGNERFAQYLASNNCHFKLDSFTDKTCAQGYDMSPFIRRYAKYLNAKFMSYRHMAFDFCKIKKGQDGGVLRVMEAELLLKTLPVLQQQVDALLEFEVATNNLTNPVIKAGFMMLFKDLIRLLACYNDGIINLLAKFFDMNKKQCKDALDIYKKFVLRMEGVEKFFKVAESIGIDKGDIPDLAKAPSSLVDTLEAHIKTMEGNKKGASKSSGATVSAAISNLTAAASSHHIGSAAGTDDDGGFLFESDTVGSTNPFADDAEDGGGEEDLLGLGDDFGGADNGSGANNPFLDGDDDDDGVKGGASVIVTNDDPWASLGDTGSSKPGNDFAEFEVTFDSNPIPAVSPARTPSPSMALFGLDMSKTSAPPSGISPLTSPSHSGQMPRPASNQKLIQGDLDTSLALLAGNLDMKDGSQNKKNDISWNGTDEKRLTGSNSNSAGWTSNLSNTASPVTSPQHAPAVSPSKAPPVEAAPVDDDPFADLL